jgi:hypothetical protein
MTLRPEERNAARARSALWPATRRTLRALGAPSPCGAEATVGVAIHAGRGDSSGSAENTGNAHCERHCLPRTAIALKPVGGPLPAALREPDLNALPATAGLAVASAGGATDRAAFPDPLSNAFRASVDLAVAAAGNATKRVGFPDPPSSALGASAGLAVDGARRAPERVAFPDPPSNTPVRRYSRQVRHPSRLPERTQRRKNRQVRYPSRLPERTQRRKNRQVRYPPRFPKRGERRRNRQLRRPQQYREAQVSRPRRRRSGWGGPAAESRPRLSALGLMVQTRRKTKPPCRKSLACPKVATRVPENRKPRRNPGPCLASHSPQAREGAGPGRGAPVSHWMSGERREVGFFLKSVDGWVGFGRLHPLGSALAFPCHMGTGRAVSPVWG